VEYAQVSPKQVFIPSMSAGVDERGYITAGGEPHTKPTLQWEVAQMAKSGPHQKALPHELVDRFASEIAPPGKVGGKWDGGWTSEESGGLVGGRMVRVMIQYAEGAP
jgi:hypothetical protein